MATKVVVKDDQYILNHCTKSLARDIQEGRHNFGQFLPDDPRGRYCEGWRFPVVDSFSDGQDPVAGQSFNEVSFIYPALEGPLPNEVLLTGSFAPLYEPLVLRRVADLPYFSVTVVIPKGEVHSYRYRVDGVERLDPVNPQRVTLDNGAIWSRFFTQECTVRLELERWEWCLLERITEHILPFRTAEGENFLRRYHDFLDRQARISQHPHAHRHEQSVGVVNFIDKLLCREEAHHRADYHVCLELIDRVLRLRNPFVEPARMSRELFVDLYAEMAAGAVPGWDYSRYGNPRYFLQLLRRHTFTGAFSHPKYGGNAGAAAWAYLADRYRDGAGNTLFDWQRNLEPPLGVSPAYRG